MRLLIDADLPRQCVELIRRYGHEAQDIRDIGMGKASDPEIARAAHGGGYGLVTGDFGFADVRTYPPESYFGIVVLVFPNDATANFILGLVQSLFERPELLDRLPGRLAIVEPGRIRFRPSLKS
jgi:predicted nuclease of predicted toxin-antitoxin system